jgi:AraC-like DNA-binding protein
VSVSSFVVGMYDEPAVTEHEGAAGGVQIDLTPAGARALLATPLDELRNRVVPLDAFPSVALDRLVDRLLDAPGWEAQVEVLDAELRPAIAAGPALTPQVAAVERRLRADPSVRIGSLAEEVGWTRATLVERFRREVGLPPKTLARLLRFRSAAAQLGSGSTPIARVAVECGYADQAHLTREVRAFAGCTPRQLVAPAGGG